MNSNQRHYYLGFAEALLYLVADLDTKETAERDIRPTLKGRLPADFYEMNGDAWESRKFVTADFLEVIRKLDEDGSCVRIRISEADSFGERTFELAHSEGYRGIPEDMEDCYP